MLRYLTQAPRSRSAPFVAGFYDLSIERAGAGASWQHVMPDGEVELTVQMGAPILRVDGSQRTGSLSRAYVVSRMMTSYHLKRTGPAHVVGVRFRPGGFTALTGVPVSALVDTFVPAEDVLGPAVHALLDKLHCRKKETTPLSILEAWLSSLAGSSSLSANRYIDIVVSRIIASRGQATLAEICADLPIGLRRLEQCFANSVGAGPKAFSRMVRFQNALRSLDRRDDLDAMDAVVNCGYYDHSHLIREFRSFAGITPAEYRAGAFPLHDLMARA